MKGLLHLVLRLLCFSAFAAGVVVAGVNAWRCYVVDVEVGQATAADTQDLTEGLKAGIAHAAESGRTMTQTVLIISAALWGLILGKKDERMIVLGNGVSCGMTVISNVVVGGFLYAYHVLDSSIARLLFTASKVDGKEIVMHIDNARLAELIAYQLYLFVAATAAIGSTLVYAHAVRKE